MNELVPNTGNYKALLSYKKSDTIFRITNFFECMMRMRKACRGY